MIRGSIFIFFLLLTNSFSASSQAPGNIPGELSRLFTRISLNISPGNKLAANDSIRSIIDNYAHSDTVFKHRFRNIRYLGQITSPDSLVMLLTWNLVLPDKSGRYFCYVISRRMTGQKPVVSMLEAGYRENPPQSIKYNSKDWYGALYYDLRPFTADQKKYYVILGIDYGNSFITRKYIDVLDLSDPADPGFGLACFSDGKSVLNRIMFQYSSSAVMSLRFESDQSIVFDHLSPFLPEFKGNYQFYGPDFTFDSYNFEKGFWKFKSDIDIKNRER